MFAICSRTKPTRSPSHRTLMRKPQLEVLEDRRVLTPVLWPTNVGGNGHYYELIEVESASWSSAKAASESSTFMNSQGHLATITSSAENNFLGQLVQGSPRYFFWLGGHQTPTGAEPAGGWQWITGESWNYQNWAPGEPSNNGNGLEEDALELYTDRQPQVSFKWNDANDVNLGDPPNARGSYIVEFEPNADIHMLSAQLQTGNSVQFTYETTGNPGPFDVGLYRSTDGITYNPADLIATQPITPSATNPQTATLALPFPWQGNPTKPYLVVAADPSNQIQESNDNNNTASARLPDLAATTLTLDTVQGGVNFSYDVSGADVSLNTTVALYWASGPNYADRIGSAFSTSASLSVGSYGPIHVDQSALSAAPAGTTHLLVRADDFAVIAESDEDNNVRSLELSNIRIVHAITDDSRQVRFDYEVTGAPAGQFEVKLYRSTRQNFTPETFDPAQDKQIGPISVLTNTAPGTFSGVIASKAGFEPLAIDAKHPYVFIVADPQAHLVETKEDDNSAFFEKRVLGVVTHGFAVVGPLNLGSPNWITQMSDALHNNRGYDRSFPYYWTQWSGVAASGMTQLAGVDLAHRIESEITQMRSQWPNAVIDLHLIGHSRGAVVISHALQNLQSNSLVGGLVRQGFTRLTMLDPHPARNQFGIRLFSASPTLPGFLAAAIVVAFQSQTRDPDPYFPAFTDQPELYFQQSPWFLAASPYTPVPLSVVFNLWGQSSVLNLSGRPVFSMNLTGFTNHEAIHDFYFDFVLPNL